MQPKPYVHRFLLSAALLVLTANAMADELSDDIASLEHGWAKASYQTPEDQKEAAFAALQDKAHAVSTQFAGRAEALIWEGIITSSHAKYQGVFAAGKSAKLARDLLQSAQKIDANALDGSVYVSLGALYYKVPGWPLSFGDKTKASELLQQGLKIDPSSIDANFFYGDFLAEHGDRQQAIEYLNRALAAPPRVGREDADAGRRTEIRNLLATLAP
jgi:tetratricopeptide (TPR) repeat protein